MPSSSSRLSHTLLLSLVFLLFFQLVSDFVETIYAFGLLSTSIPPQIVSILLFFSPLLLLFFKRGLPYRAGLILAVIAALARSVEVIADTSTKMLVSGLGFGCLLLFFPVWLNHPEEKQGGSAVLEAGFGLLGGLALSALLRIGGLGTDLSLLYPWLSWVLALILLVLVILAWNQASTARPVEKKAQTHSFISLVHVIGFMGALSVLYFAFSSPLVMARWSGVDDRLLVGLLVLTLGLFALAYIQGWLEGISYTLFWLWNVLFLAAGTAAILINQVTFPTSSAAFPISQPEISLVQQIPLLLMILLSPIALLDLIHDVRELRNRQPSPRTLATGFFLGAAFLLFIVLTQVMTTVYDYIPVVGPWLRDCFWLVFLMAGLGMVLPALVGRSADVDLAFQATAPANRLVYFPVVILLLLASFGWDLANQPSPVTPTAATSLRIVTYNIQQGYSDSGQRNYLGQLDVIRNLDPDIVGLEETDVARFSGGNADEVRTIANGLDMYSYYGPRTVTGTFGIALLSRYPLINPHTIFMYSDKEQTAAIEAHILVNGVTYNIVVTHLGNGGPIIQQQDLLSYIQGQSNLIVMGDYNFRPATPQYALTLKSLQDAWVQVGSPLPASLDPASLIDHIFITPDIRVKSVQYVDSPASDHPVLLVEITP